VDVKDGVKDGVAVGVGVASPPLPELQEVRRGAIIKSRRSHGFCISVLYSSHET
jgi:hypothetical protein